MLKFFPRGRCVTVDAVYRFHSCANTLAAFTHEPSGFHANLLIATSNAEGPGKPQLTSFSFSSCMIDESVVETNKAEAFAFALSGNSESDNIKIFFNSTECTFSAGVKGLVLDGLIEDAVTLYNSPLIFNQGNKVNPTILLKDISDSLKTLGIMAKSNLLNEGSSFDTFIKLLENKFHEQVQRLNTMSSDLSPK